MYGTLEDGLFGAGWASRTTTTVDYTTHLGCGYAYRHRHREYHCILEYFPLMSSTQSGKVLNPVVDSTAHEKLLCPKGYYDTESSADWKWSRGCFYTNDICPLTNDSPDPYDGRPYHATTTTPLNVIGSRLLPPLFSGGTVLGPLPSVV